MGVVVRAGGKSARPHHLPLLIPPPHAAERRGEGARGWGFCTMGENLFAIVYIKFAQIAPGARDIVLVFE